MAHELEIKEGIASYFGVQKPAWHGLGNTLDGAQTQEQVLEMGFLNYEVCKRKIYVEHPGEYKNGVSLVNFDKEQHAWYLSGLIDVSDHWAITRCDTGKVFGFVKGRYEVIQNSEAFKFFDEFCEVTEAIYHTAGVLFDGQIAWILAKLPDHIEVNGDNIDMYVLVTMYHDGKHAMQLMFTPIRVVCWNTLTAATNACRNIVNVRHNVNYESRIKQAVETMGIKNTYVREIEEVFREMAETNVSDQIAVEYFNKLVTGKKNIEGIKITTAAKTKIAQYIEYYQNHETQQQLSVHGTVFGLYNAVTGYYQNMKEYKDPERRFNNIFVKGDASRASADAFHLATMML